MTREICEHNNQFGHCAECQAAPSALITPRFKYVEGPFDMATGKLSCVRMPKYASVWLCFRENMNISFASIKLHDSDRLFDAQAVMEDAGRLGDEIVRRWNEYGPLKTHARSLERLYDQASDAANRAQRVAHDQMMKPCAQDKELARLRDLLSKVNAK